MHRLWNICIYTADVNITLFMEHTEIWLSVIGFMLPFILKHAIIYSFGQILLYTWSFLTFCCCISLNASFSICIFYVTTVNCIKCCKLFINFINFNTYYITFAESEQKWVLLNIYLRLCKKNIVFHHNLYPFLNSRTILEDVRRNPL